MDESQMKRLEERAETVSEEEKAAEARQRVRSVPLPPQLREEKKAPLSSKTSPGPASVSREQASVSREQAEHISSLLTKGTSSEANEITEVTEIREVTGVCDTCGTPTNGAFSFCTSCGTDLPVPGTAKKSKRVRSHGIRDTRETLHRMAALHDQANQSQQVRQVSQGGVQQKQYTKEMAENIRGEIRERGEIVVGVVPPGVAAISSFFIPGSGQVLNGQNFKGIWLLIAWAFFAFLLNSPAPIMLIAAIIASVDAYKIAKRRQRGETIEPLEWDLT